MRSNYFRDGKLWSREVVRLLASALLDDNGECALAPQRSAMNPFRIAVNSNNQADGGQTALLLVATFGGGMPLPGDIARLELDAPYDYVVTGDETGSGDMLSGLIAVVNAANGGDGDPNFNVYLGGSDLFVEAKVAGPAANSLTKTLTFISETATANLIVEAYGADPTGALTVRVDFLDIEGFEKSETLTLNGHSTVMTTLDAIWVQRLTVTSAGVDGCAFGTICAYIDENTYAAIFAGEVQSRNCSYMVPATKQFRIDCINVSAAYPVRARLRTNFDCETDTHFAFTQFAAAEFIAGPCCEEFEFCDASPAYPAGTVLVLTVQRETSDTTAVASILGYLEPAGTIA